MRRYLNEVCKNCADNEQNLMMCIELCNIPIEILENIEKNRKKRDEYIEIPGQIKVEFDILK